MARPHLRGLDTLRGLAALGVALYHARFALGLPSALPHAYLCVDFFFVLSGLVVYRSYANALAEGLPVSRFLWNRLARLGPLYIVATLIGIGLFAAAQRAGHQPMPAGRMIGAAALNLIALPCPPGLSLRADGALYPYLVPAWSIAWELVLSVAFAAWVKLGRPGLVFIAAASCLALLAGTFDRDTIDFGWTAERPWIGGVRALLGFAMGALCAQSLEAANRSDGARRGLALTGMVCAAAAMICICLPIRPDLVLKLACPMVLFPVLTYCAAAADPAWLKGALGEWLGRLSYASYLLHGAVIDVSAALANRILHKGSTGAAVGAGVLFLTAMPIVCWLFYTRFERPMQAWLLSLWRERRRPAETPPSVGEDAAAV